MSPAQYRPARRVKPDAAVLAEFTAAVFRHADPKSTICFRAFEDGDDSTSKPVISPTTPGMWVSAKDRDRAVNNLAMTTAAHAKSACFCPPTCTFNYDKTRPGSARESDVANGLLLSVDADKAPGAAWETLTALLGEPTLTVESGGYWLDPDTGEVQPKAHLHWRLKAESVTRTPEDHARLREARVLACAIVGGDPSNGPLSHPLRWPGSVHRKAEPRLASIVATSDNEIDLIAALDALRAAYTGPVIDMTSPIVDGEGSTTATVADIASALEQIPNDDLDWEGWNRIGMAAFAGSDGSAFDAFDAWSRKSAKYDPAATLDRWQHFAQSPPTRIGAGTLFKMANDAAGSDWVRPSNVVPLWTEEELAAVAARGKPQQADDDTGPDPFGPEPDFEEDVAAEAPRKPADAPKRKRLITPTRFVPVDVSAFPRRQWMYGRHMSRKYVSTTVAPGAVGKSSLTTVEALSLVTGRNLLDVMCHEGPLKVWYVNLEDPAEEITRKVLAACVHYKLSQETVAEGLFLDSGRNLETPFCIAHQGKDGVTIVKPMVDDLIAAIREMEIDVLILDPFVSTHGVNENDNGAIDKVAKTFSKIADETNIAIELIHHVKKSIGPGGHTVEDGRGAGSLLAVARSGRVLNLMTPEEAERAGGVDCDYFFRADYGKANLSPKPDRSDWYQRVPVDLGNAGPTIFDPGDSVGVVEAWKWPAAPEPALDLHKTQMLMSSGGWREDVQTRDRWVGHCVALAHDDLDAGNKAHQAKIKRIVAAWIADGSFKRIERKDENRKMRAFIEIGTPCVVGGVTPTMRHTEPEGGAPPL